MNRKTFLKSTFLGSLVGLIPFSLKAKPIEKSNSPELYLEISARVTGKTYRLIKAVNDWLNENQNNIAFIYCVMPNRFKNYPSFKELIEKKNLNRIFFNQYTWISCGGPIRKFYDEFEMLGFEVEWNTEKFRNYDYFCTSPHKIRTLEDAKKNRENKKDNLLNLIELNNGKVISYSIINPFTCYEILDNIEPEKYFSNEFEMSYLNKFFTI